MASTEQLVAALERAPAIVIPLVRQANPAILKRRPAPGEWSIHENACHLAEVHPLFFRRLDLMLSETNPAITSYDPGRADPDNPLLKLDLTDLWVERVEKQYRDRAPRLVANPRDPHGAYFHYEGYAPHPIGIGLAAGKSPEELAQFLTRGTYADARPGGWDPAERLKDNELDGVEGDVLYTTLGFRIFWLKDAGLQQECFRVYNDWLAAYCSYAPKRMAGLALISLYDA